MARAAGRGTEGANAPKRGLGREREHARTPAKLDGRRDRFEIVAGDLDEPASLGPALDGINRVFLLSPGPDGAAQEAAVIEASVQAGVSHPVMLSSLGAELGGIAGGGPHMPGEALLRESGLGATLLHPSEFMTNTIWWRDTIESAGSIFVPTSARLPHTCSRLTDMTVRSIG